MKMKGFKIVPSSCFLVLSKKNNNLKQKTKNKEQRTRAGFTLIELSMVLVIIGLIVAGISGGYNLIHSAKLMSVISDIRKYESATNSFSAQFNALPGDFSRATEYWPAQTRNGDGDDSIRRNFGEAPNNEEDLLVWQHLSLAEFISGDYTGEFAPGNTRVPGINLPKSKVKNGGYQLLDHMTHLRPGHRIGFASFAEQLFRGPIINAPDAWGIDKKIDDGKADKGTVHGLKGRIGNVRINDSTRCVTGNWNSATSKYLPQAAEETCRLAIFID